MTNAHPTSISYRPDIDGLRAVAVVAVLLFHFGVPGIQGGFAGVDVFFVISGFLITSILVREMERGEYSLAAFYERRIRRIFPALIVVLLASMVAAWFLLLPSHMRRFGDSLTASVLFFANIHFADQWGYFDVDSELKPLLHMWSLAVEEQFYLAFPPLLMLLMKKGRRLATWVTLLALVASFIAGLFKLKSNATLAFYYPQYRVWELLIGSMLAFDSLPQLTRKVTRELVTGAGLIAVVASVFLLDSTNFPGFAALAPTLGTAALIHGGKTQPSWASRLLSLRPVVFVGLISYSLYLWHWPLLVFARHRSLTPLSVPSLVGLAVLAVLLAVASYYFVESPLRRPTVLASARLRLFSGAVGCMLVCALVGYSAASEGWPKRLPKKAASIDKAAWRSTRRIMKSFCKDKSKAEARAGACHLGSEGVKPSFVLWGDSQAASLAHTVHKVAREKSLSGSIVSSGGCAPLMGIKYFSCPTKPPRAIESPSVEHVLLFGAWERKTDDELRRGLTNALEHIKRKGKRVTIFGPVPQGEVDFPDVLARAAWFRKKVDLRIPRADHEARQRRVFSVLTSLQKKYDFELVRPDSRLCDKKYCKIQHKKAVLYGDGHHLSQAGADRLKPLIAKVLEPRPDVAQTNPPPVGP